MHEKRERGQGVLDQQNNKQWESLCLNFKQLFIVFAESIHLRKADILLLRQPGFENVGSMCLLTNLHDHLWTLKHC